MKSIIQSDTNRCYLCGRNGTADRLEEHHVFGASNRKHSEEDGLKVYLCGNSCHRNGKYATHQNKDVSEYLKKKAQRAWMDRYGSLEMFRARYGKNYL